MMRTAIFPATLPTGYAVRITGGTIMRITTISVLVAVSALTAWSAQSTKNKKDAAATPAAPAATTPAPDKGKLPDITQDYVIGAEDVLGIMVYGELNDRFNVKEEQVRPDGIITMPLVGELKAMGKTPRALEAEIAKALADKYLRTTPMVMVQVLAVHSRYFLITGGVNKPGKYDLLVPTTIMEALVNAGGFHEFANRKKINLIRDNKVFVTFNFEDALKGKHPERNVLLQHGDIIAIKE